jgi:cytochrome c-type biogenesis protein CcmH
MSFSILLGLMLLVASLFVLYPFVFGVRTDEEPSANAEHANVGIFRDQQSLFKHQLDGGEITSEQYEQLLLDAQQLLLANTASAQTPGSLVSAKGLWLLPLLMTVIALGTLFTYSKLGAQADEEILALMAAGSDYEMGSEEAQQWSADLNAAIAARVEQRPENIYYWAMLAQGAIAQGDIASASDYFAAAIEVEPKDSFLLSQYAESLFLLAENRFTPEVVSAMDKAFALDSSNPTVLGLKGIQAFENRELQLAITYWQGARQGLDPNSSTSQALLSGIQRATQLLGLVADNQTAIGPVIELLVSLEAGIAFEPDQLVFVAAVRGSGSPMPLAARKLRAADLPALVKLSDRDALMAGQNLSSVTQVRLVARLSNSGSATPQSGDWEVGSKAINLADIKGQIPLVISTQRP